MICLSLKAILKLLQTSINTGNGRAGIMIPIPQYPLYSATLSEMNSYQVIKQLTDLSLLIKNNLGIFVNLKPGLASATTQHVHIFSLIFYPKSGQNQN